MKITPREKRRHFSLSPPRLAFLAWGDFHARLRFARSTITEEKWGTTRNLVGFEHDHDLQGSSHEEGQTVIRKLSEKT